jgi:hypothetical protein
MNFLTLHSAQCRVKNGIPNLKTEDAMYCVVVTNAQLMERWHTQGFSNSGMILKAETPGGGGGNCANAILYYSHSSTDVT